MSAKKKKPRIIDGVECWQCNKCMKWLVADLFNKRSSAANGLRSWCGACDGKAANEYHHDHREHCVEWSRQYRRDNLRKERERNCQWRKENPKKASDKDRRQREKRRSTQNEYQARVRKTSKGRARAAVAAAVRYGRLIKPDRCEGCNEPFEKHLLEGHHEDYSKPLEVEWLCSKCHGKKSRLDETEPGDQRQ